MRHFSFTFADVLFELAWVFLSHQCRGVYCLYILSLIISLPLIILFIFGKQNQGCLFLVSHFVPNFPQWNIVFIGWEDANLLFNGHNNWIVELWSWWKNWFEVFSSFFCTLVCYNHSLSFINRGWFLKPKQFSFDFDREKVS